MGIWTYGDDFHLTEKGVAEVQYPANYPYGERYAEVMMQDLENVEAERLGSREKAQKYILRNKPLIMQGMLTGTWAPFTHMDFFKHHFWPKAREYCESD